MWEDYLIVPMWVTTAASPVSKTYVFMPKALLLTILAKNAEWLRFNRVPTIALVGKATVLAIWHSYLREGYCADVEKKPINAKSLLYWSGVKEGACLELASLELRSWLGATTWLW